MSRKIDLIILHCSSSDNPDQDSIMAITDLHTSPKTKKIKWGKYDTTGKGFIACGYHFFINKKGLISEGRSMDLPGAHCEGHNANSIGICLSGEDVDLFTHEQFESLKKLLLELMKNYDLTPVDILPHKAFNKNKTCPNFNLGEFFKKYLFIGE